MCGPWGAALKTPFSRLSCSSQLKGPISSKSASFSSQARKLEIFSSQATSPKISKFSELFREANISSQPTGFGNPGRTPLPEKRWGPPPGRPTGMSMPWSWPFLKLFQASRPGGTIGLWGNSPEKGYGDECDPQDPLFKPLLRCVTRLPVEAQVRSQDPQVHLKKMWHFSSKALSNHFLENRAYVNFQKLKFDRDFRQKSWKFCKISVLFSMQIRSHFCTPFYPRSPEPPSGNPYLPVKKKKI